MRNDVKNNLQTPVGFLRKDVRQNLLKADSFLCIPGIPGYDRLLPYRLEHFSTGGVGTFAAYFDSGNTKSVPEPMSIASLTLALYCALPCAWKRPVIFV
jgi:hypothetical protein